MKNEKGLVSVVIANFNMANFLPKAIESILSQTYDNLEIVIVDDGSTDNSKEVMCRYELNPKVRCIYQPNLGQPKAKNAGVFNSNGEFIAFCDADDIWDSKKLEKQIPCFDRDPNIGVVYSNAVYIDKNDIAVHSDYKLKKYSGNITNELFVKNCIPFGTAVVKTECFINYGGFNESIPMGIDWELWLRLSVHFKFFFLNETTYYYRVWDGQMSRNYRGRYSNAETIMKQFLLQYPEGVSKKNIRRGWADTYVGKGSSIANREKLFFEPFYYFIKAAAKDPTYLPVWKSLIKLVLGRF